MGTLNPVPSYLLIPSCCSSRPSEFQLCNLTLDMQRTTVTPNSCTLVNWSLLEFALKPCSPTFQMWLSKFASGHSAVGKMMALWKQWESPLCPLCHSSEETTCHIIQCPNAAHISHWHQLLEEFCLWLIQANMHPDITHCLLVMLHGQGQSSYALAAPPSCCSATSQQDLIGFFGFMLGCLSSLWEATQAQFWLKKQASKSPTHWV